MATALDARPSRRCLCSARWTSLALRPNELPTAVPLAPSRHCSVACLPTTRRSASSASGSSRYLLPNSRRSGRPVELALSRRTKALQAPPPPRLLDWPLPSSSGSQGPPRLM
eukprot:9466111-Pyramimonas_sp.AAC.1